jgi:hypothetical protein
MSQNNENQMIIKGASFSPEWKIWSHARQIPGESEPIFRNAQILAVLLINLKLKPSLNLRKHYYPNLELWTLEVSDQAYKKLTVIQEKNIYKNGLK